jgi:uncharacterized membrane protein YeaQ/YmgE (transglycosylase-associated protein family)
VFDTTFDEHVPDMSVMSFLPGIAGLSLRSSAISGPGRLPCQAPIITLVPGLDCLVIVAEPTIPNRPNSSRNNEGASNGIRHHRLACDRSNRWLAGQIVKGGGFGLVVDIIVGIVGAVIGGFLAGVVGISAGGIIGSIILAVIGAVVLLVVLRIIKRA